MRKHSTDHIRRVIQKGDYMATIVHAHFEKNKKGEYKEFYLWWIIDTGSHIGHKISQKFPCSEFGDKKMQVMCRRIKINYHPTITEPNKIFPLQFICKRGKISVDIQHIQGKYTRNIITHHQVATSPPEENVAKPKTVDHFYKEKTGRKLPL